MCFLLEGVRPNFCKGKQSITADVAGVDEAKELEVVDFLKNPAK